MEEAITQVNFCRDLGVMMQDDASFKMHQEKVTKKVRQKCGWVLRTFYTREQKFLKHMWNTLIQPHLDYCSQLWAPSEGANLESLDGLLRSYTSKIPAVKHLNFWDRLSKLKLNSVGRRNERYRIIYTWKILEGLVPNCGVKEESESMETRLGRSCEIPKLAGSNEVRKLRSQSFQVTGPSLFNVLPKYLQNLTKIEVNEFKELLDNYLTDIPDKPKVAGIQPTCLTSNSVASNSLLHWIPLRLREAVWRRPGA